MVQFLKVDFIQFFQHRAHDIGGRNEIRRDGSAEIPTANFHHVDAEHGVQQGVQSGRGGPAPVPPRRPPLRVQQG